MAESGRTDEEIADALGISRTTLTAWKGARPDFKAAISAAKDVANEMVEVAAFQRATGYSHPAIKIFCNEGQITTHEYTEHLPPDPQAIRFWLMNRARKRWLDPQRFEHTGKDGAPIQASVTDVAAVVAAVREFAAAPVEAVDEFE